MKQLKRVSRWITINGKVVTEMSDLYYYGEETETNKRYVLFFRWNNREYALNQFLSRYGMMGFDKNCEVYPDFITGYDGTNYYNLLLCELDDYGERIRLYTEI